jgi:anaerobic magnesium-protoporphyrin IX monomethyl ester cyclase
MTRVMLVQPWNYHDEGVQEHDLSNEWRNGPYSLLLLASELKNKNHTVQIVDLNHDLVLFKGDLNKCLTSFAKAIEEFKPEIIGVTFFSIHFFEAEIIVRTARKTCDWLQIKPIMLGGGIHATLEPKSSLEQLGFDYIFIGEADIGIVDLADGKDPLSIRGVVDKNTIGNITDPKQVRGVEIKDLDSLPFPDWSMIDYIFYAHPTYARVKIAKSSSLDIMMGRGCTKRCSFCAYSATSSVRYYSADYLIRQIKYMITRFGISEFYFIDSSIGNNTKLLREFCVKMIETRLNKTTRWYGNIRVDQVDENLLKLMWDAGCRYLFYGFESGSQRILDLMNKRVSVEDNYRVAELHNKLKFPYNASMIFGYPGEREEDIQESMKFLRAVLPPSVGINCYVPLPGSPDYYQLLQQGKIHINNPVEWRTIGECNPSKIYADIPEERFKKLLNEAYQFAYTEIPQITRARWGNCENNIKPHFFVRLIDNIKKKNYIILNLKQKNQP